MTPRAFRIGSAIAVIVALVAFGPMVVAQVTGRPLILDCGGLERGPCEEKQLEAAEAYERHGFGVFPAGPITYFAFDPQTSEGTCGTVTIERGTLTFGILAMTAQPLC